QVEGGDVLESAHILGHGRPRASQDHDLTRHRCGPRRNLDYSTRSFIAPPAVPPHAGEGSLVRDRCRALTASGARHTLATMRASRLVSISLPLSIAACNRDYPTPFSQSTTSHPPPASAAIIFTSGQWSQQSAGREVYAMNLDGSGVTQLTSCNGGDTPCDTA